MVRHLPIIVLILVAVTTATGQAKISATSGGFSGDIGQGDRFGQDIVRLGDLDGDGVTELAATAPLADNRHGELWILFLNENGTVRKQQRIGRSEGGFSGQIEQGVGFGSSLGAVGDVNGDGVPDLAVGYIGDSEFGWLVGSVWMMFNLATLPSQINIDRPDTALAVAGEDIDVLAEIVSVSKVNDARVAFRRGGDATAFSAVMAPIGAERYSFSIPAFAVGERGVEYWISSDNEAGRSSRTPDNGAISLPVYVPEGLQTTLGAGTTEGDYRLFSIPLDLDQSDARQLLEDDLGPYRRSAWRFFEYESPAFIDLDDRDITVTPGRAYWAVSKLSGRVVTTGAGRSITTGEPYEIPLDPDWNLVSNPFNFAIPVSNASFATGNPAEL
jgi:hypothetical protein